MESTDTHRHCCFAPVATFCAYVLRNMLQCLHNTDHILITPSLNTATRPTASQVGTMANTNMIDSETNTPPKTTPV